MRHAPILSPPLLPFLRGHEPEMGRGSRHRHHLLDHHGADSRDRGAEASLSSRPCRPRRRAAPSHQHRRRCCEDRRSREARLAKARQSPAAAGLQAGSMLMPSVDESIALIRDLIAFPTVSRDPNKALLAYVETYLARHGVRSEIIWNDDRSKGNLWATIGPPNRSGVILSGHSDVVPVDDQSWTSDPFRLRECDGRLYGRGACDMKGFVGIVLAFVPELCRRDLKVPVHIAISYDEELGCTGVLSLVDRLRELPVKPALCIVGEPTSMRLVLGHKSGTEHVVTVKGTAAHSSFAPRAINAIEYAAELITFIHEIGREIAATGEHDPLYEIPHSTLSVTIIKGGTAFNIIPERCVFGIDMRALPSLDVPAVIARIEDFARSRLLPRMQAI